MLLKKGKSSFEALIMFFGLKRSCAAIIIALGFNHILKTTYSQTKNGWYR